MICAICPITVKKVLTKVSGVSKTDVNLDSHEAKEAVYPSTAAGSAK